MTEHAVPLATAPVLHALLDQAHRLGWRGGVLGARARPQWEGPDRFEHDGLPVHVVPCGSALAVREALLERRPDRWLVVLTDRDEDDLGAGIRSRLVWNRLRTPDPWDAVRHRFAAAGLDPALTSGPAHREVAGALLAATPAAGWPPAPGGVLTRDHALAAVAAAHLGLGGVDSLVDTSTVLAWTLDPDATPRLADLRAGAAAALTDPVIDWVTGRCAAAADPIARQLRAGTATDVVPLGLVVGLLAEVAGDGDATDRLLARDARIRLEGRLGPAAHADDTLRHWAVEATNVCAGLLDTTGGRTGGERILARADALLQTAGGGALADRSELLPAGLTARLGRVAAALRTAVGSVPAVGDVGADTDVDAALVSDATAAVAERCWSDVRRHRLADGDQRVTTFVAAVRLLRWLAVPSAVPDGGLAALLARHAATDAWVDSAVNDAATGVGDPELGDALAAVLAATRRRRDAHDTDFARALGRHTYDDPGAVQRPGGRRHGGVRHLEDVLPDVVVPLARQTPVLLAVLDGMSSAVCAEVVASVQARAADGWLEALLPGEQVRAAALAVLPTLTSVSRTSLFCGELRTGAQEAERVGFAELVRAAGLPAAVLFHKRLLDESRPGHAVADDVVAALDDVTGRPLVACVLNTIDDALDRSDPGGTDWHVEAVKHLGPLLERARLAGRVVVLTADHGHVIERRQGTSRPHQGISSSRSRPVPPDAGDGEVLVTGRRVLEHGGRAVLAVDERLRYGPLKAGYHGGATPAEAVVPLCVLVSGAVPHEADLLRLAPPQEPAWWAAAVPVAPAVTAVPTDTLFELAPAAGPAEQLAARVVSSPTYSGQRRIAGRVPVTDDQVRRLLTGLLEAPERRLPPARAAAILGVAEVTLRGAVLAVQRLLNVESYPVLRLDVDGTTVVVDEPLLREQFELPS